MIGNRDIFFNPPIEELKKTPDEMSEEFVQFIVENAYTSDQVKEAYYRFVGISDNEKNDESVDVIEAKMKELNEDGFPLNRFAKIIDVKKNIENDIVPMYHKFINNLSITDKEKGILLSIVDKDRKGDIEFFIDEELFVTLTIDSSVVMSKDHIIAALMTHFGDFIKIVPPGKKYSFTFSEE